MKKMKRVIKSDEDFVVDYKIPDEGYQFKKDTCPFCTQKADPEFIKRYGMCPDCYDAGVL